MSDTPELRAGTVLGPYRIVRCIGVGGMGAVYEAEHCELRKRVALKTPHSEAGLSSEGRARFVQEGKTASKIRHPHVVDITDVGEVDDVAYLVMEYLEGEPLSALIAREGPLPARLIADILVPVAAALHEAHGMGIIHRDLKPDNIFLTRTIQGNIHPKVVDFGVSKVLGDDKAPKLTYANVLLGTPQYIAPEHLQVSQAITDKSDQYSLGVVLYEASTGSNPFVDYTSLISILRAIDKSDYRRPSELNPNVDERLAGVALRAMSASPGARFPSMAALGAQLLPMAGPDTRTAWSRYLAESQGSAIVVSEPRTTPKSKPHRPAWVGAAAFLVLVGAGAAAIGAVRPSQLESRDSRPLQAKVPSGMLGEGASALLDAVPAEADPESPVTTDPRAPSSDSASVPRAGSASTRQPAGGAERSEREVVRGEMIAPESNLPLAQPAAAELSKSEVPRGRMPRRRPSAGTPASNNPSAAKRERSAAKASQGAGIEARQSADSEPATDPLPLPEPSPASHPLPSDSLKTDNVNPWDT
jgi:serine/threonine protein kinase